MKPQQTFPRQLVGLAALGALTSILSCRLSPAQTVPVQTVPPQAVAVPAEEPIHGMVGVGTWGTQAEFKDIRVTKGNQTLFASDFSKGLQGWKTIRGKWEVVDGTLRQTSDEEDARALIGDPTWSDYTLTLKARKISGNEGFLILFGLPDEDTRSWWNIGGWGNTKSGIQAPATSSADVPGQVEAGRWYDIKIELSGNTIRTYLDNKLVQTETQTPATHTLAFSTDAPGKKLPLTNWGLDTAWAVPDNMRRGILYMGKDQVDTVRVSFPINEPLVNGDLPASKNEHFTTRIEIAKMAGDKPWTMLPDTEAGVNPWYKNGRDVIPERWVQLMAASQRRYGKKLASVEAFNEADYGWGQGSAENLNNILGVLKQNPDFAGVKISGPSTLNDDWANPWYQTLKGRLDQGTTHSLGGSMESYINFYRNVVADGKVADQPEVHNLVEVIAGAEYGLQSAIWWGTAEYARGEFVKAVQGERLAYAEDRPRWSAAGVYRAPSGKVQAFIGTSERMGQTTSYHLISQDRPVFFNGDGPRRDFTYTIPGGRNADAAINITWGQDVQPKVEGRYVIVNRKSGQVLGVVGANKENGADIQQMDYNKATNQQWDVAPLVTPVGDQSYFALRAVHSGKTLDTADWNYDEGGRIQQWGAGEAGAQHWYFDYAGDNCFYIRSRWSTKCLGIAGASQSAGASVQQFSLANVPNLQWRLVPVSGLKDSPLDFVAPHNPTGLTASPKPMAVALQWNANREADLSDYTVFRSTKAGGPYDTIARGVTGNSFIDTDVSAQTKYFYVVKAVDCSLNQSTFSVETSATPSVGTAVP
ncbi:extracellular exo-alpha-L-arabinofuranosidase [Abditibacteriota bacterium]|nr:extracellular exo-alpha-L-arabinofuranosidase [Abditibacteriota bacterium]